MDKKLLLKIAVKVALVAGLGFGALNQAGYLKEGTEVYNQNQKAIVKYETHLQELKDEGNTQQEDFIKYIEGDSEEFVASYGHTIHVFRNDNYKKPIDKLTRN